MTQCAPAAVVLLPRQQRLLLLLKQQPLQHLQQVEHQPLQQHQLLTAT